MFVCVLNFKTEGVPLLLSILTIVLLSHGHKGMKLRHSCLAFFIIYNFFFLFISCHSNLIFVGLVLLLSGFSWNSIHVELTLVLLEVKHLASLMGCAT